MNNNFIFQTIDCSAEQLSEIVDEITRYYLTIADTVDSTSYSRNVYNIKLHHIMVRCPSVRRYLKSLDCGPIKEVKFIYAFPEEKQTPHIDYCDENGQLATESYLALNFPVVNCLGTSTCFYEPIGTEERIRHPGKGVRAIIGVHDNWQLLGSYTLDRPTLINTNRYHKMINTTDKIRVSFSVRFKQDPWHLVE
jgi:hypothetical protein